MFKVDEFDWDWTKRKVIVTMPYYGKRLRQAHYALKNIKTSLDDSEWGVLVGDDGCDHDISKLENIKNVKVINVRNPKAPERNGCLCRNTLIKRCQSEWTVSVDPEIHWTGDFFKTICDHPKHAIRTGNVRNTSRETSEAILSNIINIDDVSYKVHRNFTPSVEPVDKDSLITIDPSNPYLMGTWGVHYGLALETKSWHALRGYNENITDYGPDDGDMIERVVKMIDNTFIRSHAIKRKLIVETPPCKDPQFLSDVEETKGMITNFHIASNIFATHLYHERLTGPVNWYGEELSKPGFIRNRAIEWGMLYDK
jgi:hypothetical protein